MERLSAVKSLLNEASELCNAGFAMALHINFTTPTYLYQTYNKGWMEEYTRSGFHLIDPNVRWGLENDGLISWDELETMEGGIVIERARANGMRFGNAAATSLNGSKSIAGLARSDRDFTEAELTRLSALLDEIHELTASDPESDGSFEAALRQLSVEATHG